MKSKADLIYHRGDTVAIAMTFRDRKSLAAFDLTGKELNMTVDPSLVPATADDNVMTLTGVIVGAATDGKATFTPGAGDTDFAPGDYYYDIQIQDTGTGDNKQTLVKAKFTLIQDITK